MSRARRALHPISKNAGTARLMAASAADPAIAGTPQRQNQPAASACARAAVTDVAFSRRTRRRHRRRSRRPARYRPPALPGTPGPSGAGLSKQPTTRPSCRTTTQRDGAAPDPRKARRKPAPTLPRGGGGRRSIDRPTAWREPSRWIAPACAVVDATQPWIVQAYLVADVTQPSRVDDHEHLKTLVNGNAVAGPNLLRNGKSQRWQPVTWVAVPFSEWTGLVRLRGPSPGAGQSQQHGAECRRESCGRRA